MKAHQRIIRERHAQEPDPLLEEKLSFARSFDSASVRGIPMQRRKKSSRNTSGWVTWASLTTHLGCTSVSI
jgi:hypothetical protein